MGLYNRAKSVITKAFAAGTMGYNMQGGMTASRNITSQLANFLISKSRFEQMTEEEIYEELYMREAEIGASVDKFSTMVAESFQYFIYDKSKKLKDLPDALLSNINYDENLADEMVNAANQMKKNLKIKGIIEVYAEIVHTQGQLYLEILDDLSLTILPNKDITIVDNLNRIDGTGDPNIKMTQSNYLIVLEGWSQYQRIIPKEKFYIVKYKETPVHCFDLRGRQTFGLYAVSPLKRAVIPVWQKRQITIIDILWRWSNVPRDHHTLDMEMFTLDKFVGTKDEKMVAAQSAVNNMIAAYAKALEDKVPDQGYVTTSAIKITPIEHSSSNYMAPNDIILQITDQLWGATGVPKSIVTGSSSNSYASELIVSNYMAVKVIATANNILDVIIDNIKKRLLLINARYPVDLLEAKLKFELANTKLERYRQEAVMAGIGVYTEDEIRAVDDYAPLAEDQRKNIVNIAAQKMGINNVGGSTGTGKVANTTGPQSDKYSQTPHSDNQHSTDSGQAIVNKY